MNLLASNLSNGLFVFILGLLIVFFGIAVIVLVITVIGKIMASSKNKKTKMPENVISESLPQVTADGLNSEQIAAITAVLSAYYFSNESNCDFKIKKIKRIY